MKPTSKKASTRAGNKQHERAATGRRMESRNVESLHAHPRQAEFFGDLPDHELAALAEDIRRNGMGTPPEILPDGTIIRGHQRVRAARLLDWEQIDVCVRDDLENADEETILQAFLEDNLHRRHLSTLQQARSAIALANIECDKQDLNFHWQRDAVIVKRVASRLECSDRNARRYLALSKTPLPIQEALERNLLTLVAAAGIGHLRREVQDKLAESIAKLLAQTDAKRTGAIKKKIRVLVQSTFKKNRKQKWVPAPSPTDTLYAAKKSLQGHVAELREKKEPIISQLRRHVLSSELSASAEFSFMRTMQNQIVHDVRELCHSALEVVDAIAEAIEPDAESGSCSDVGGSDPSTEADWPADTVSL